MTAFDYLVLAIVGISVLLSIMRGLMRELLALASWVIAFFVAKQYTMQVIPLLPQDIPTDALRTLAAFLLLFLATLLFCTLLGIALAQLLKKVGLGWLDRTLGGLFGFVRGVVIVSVLVMLAGLTSIPHDLRWRNAMFSAPLEYMVMSILPWMPSGIAQYVKYD